MLDELTIAARQFLMDEFSVELTIPIEVNTDMELIYGWFIFSELGDMKCAKKIEISHLIMDCGYDVAWEVLKHELVHFGLFKLGLPHNDGDASFIYACESRGVKLHASEVGRKYRLAYHRCDGCDVLWSHFRHLYDCTHTACGGSYKPLRVTA